MIATTTIIKEKTEKICCVCSPKIYDLYDPIAILKTKEQTTNNIINIRNFNFFIIDHLQTSYQNMVHHYIYSENIINNNCPSGLRNYHFV